MNTPTLGMLGLGGLRYGFLTDGRVGWEGTVATAAVAAAVAAAAVAAVAAAVVAAATTVAAVAAIAAAVIATVAAAEGAVSLMMAAAPAADTSTSIGEFWEMNLWASACRVKQVSIGNANETVNALDCDSAMIAVAAVTVVVATVA